MNNKDVPADFLNFVHKPIYDMRIQKIIHKMQGKPLMYTCPGGVIVSPNGTGVKDYTVKPDTTDKPLNYRFNTNNKDVPADFSNFVHKPIYDMRMQKSIHKMQGKPLMYTCPGGVIVSLNGTGVKDYTVKPDTTDKPLNYRFSYI